MALLAIVPVPLFLLLSLLILSARVWTVEITYCVVRQPVCYSNN